MTEQVRLSSIADKIEIEKTPMAERWPVGQTVYDMLSETTARHGSRPALSFQIKSGPKDKAETLNWAELKARVTQTANMLRDLGIGPNDTVAYLLPNANEAVFILLGGMTAGIVNPINPLLESGQIAAILRECGAKVLVTLAPFPKTDVAQKAHTAAADAPGLETILEVDLKRYLSPPLSWLIPLIRPKVQPGHKARVLDFAEELKRHDSEALGFDQTGGDERVAATFHTGGTTGMPKIALHHQRGMVYNGRLCAMHLIGPEDVLICPLPMFHVFAAYPILMTCVASGAHVVMPTPAGYRGEGVMDNFWGLVERWGVTLLIMVPTAASALMQRAINADVSSLRYAICGSAPLPVGLFTQFEKATGVRILEGYGMTEATCLVSINPPHGERKIGSVGVPIPYTQVRILHCGPDGAEVERPAGETGEICIRGPGVFPGYSDERRNEGLFTTGDDDRWLRTGDLGRIDEDGYLWITGRAKDLIIRGGHNIDPAVIEEALANHPDVAFVGAIGEPDRRAGELPCAYVELKDGATTTGDDLAAYAADHVSERAAVPKHVIVMDELPKTAVGKIFKPDLRKEAIARVYQRALADAGIEAEVRVVDDKTSGLTAEISARRADKSAVGAVLDDFARPWRMV